MNIFLIFHEKSKINLLRIDSVKKEIVNELTNCKITIFNNTDLNINMLFENNLITVIDKKYNSLYFSCIMDYIIENYETMPDKFIFWPIFSNYDIDNRVVKYIKQIDDGKDCDLFYISNNISIFNFNEIDCDKIFAWDKFNKLFPNVKSDKNMFNKVHWRLYAHEQIQKIYLLLFEEEINKTPTFNCGEGFVMLMNKTKIHKKTIEYYKKILNYMINSEHIERDECYINIFMEKIFTGVFTNNARVSNTELEEKENRKLEAETRAREEEKKKMEEETKKREAEDKKRIEDEKIKKEEEDAKRKEEDDRKREEEEKKKIEEMENLMGPIEEMENLTGSIEVNEVNEVNEVIEIMENDMMFDINIINYVDNTIRLS